MYLHKRRHQGFHQGCFQVGTKRLDYCCRVFNIIMFLDLKLYLASSTWTTYLFPRLSQHEALIMRQGLARADRPLLLRVNNPGHCPSIHKSDPRVSLLCDVVSQDRCCFHYVSATPCTEYNDDIVVTAGVVQWRNVSRDYCYSCRGNMTVYVTMACGNHSAGMALTQVGIVCWELSPATFLLTLRPDKTLVQID